MSEEDGRHPKAVVKAVPDASGTQSATQALLDDLCHRHAPVDESPPAPADSVLDLLCNHVVLLRAQEKLLPQSQDKRSLDVVYQALISAMIGVLNLFLDPDLSYTWREASMIVTKVQGNGTT